MAHYVEVPSDRLFALLEGAGFTRGIMGREVVFSRKHAKDDRLSVVVYTSAAEGARDARGCGEDAIRVVAAFTWQHRPSGEIRRKNLFKAKVLRVTSIEGVLERTIGKAREAYQACNEYRKTSSQRFASNLDATIAANQSAAREHRSASIVAGEHRPNNHRPMPERVEATYARRGYTDDDAVDDWRDRG